MFGRPEPREEGAMVLLVPLSDAELYPARETPN